MVWGFMEAKLEAKAAATEDCEDCPVLEEIGNNFDRLWDEVLSQFQEQLAEVVAEKFRDIYEAENGNVKQAIEKILGF